MKRFLCVALLCVLSVAAHAQSSMSRASLQADVNSNIVPNGAGLITATKLSGVLSNMNASMATQQDANIFSLLQQFLTPPTIVGCSGYLLGNGSSPVSCQGSIPSSSILGLGGAAALSVGTTAGTVAAGDDSRFSALTGSLLKASNLSDVSSASAARTNLGVTATGADTTYSYRANNLSDLANAATSRTNLGLGALATLSAVGAAQMSSGAAVGNLGFTPLAPANNLSELTSKSTARTNLGLGGAAMLNVGTTSSTVAAGNDSRFPASTPALIANNLSDLASASTARTNLGLGSLATMSSVTSAYLGAGVAAANLGFPPLAPGNNLSDVASASTALANLIAGNRSGNTTVVATASGSLSSGDCLKADAAGNVITTGAVCGTGGGVGSGTTNQIAYYASPGAIVTAVTPSGDCTFSGGSFTCTKTSGASFAASATTNALNASNISSGSLAAARLAAGAAVSNLGFTPLNKASNLSDLASAATGRTNLGVTFANLPDEANPTSQIDWTKIQGVVYPSSYGASLTASATTNETALASASAAAAAYQGILTGYAGGFIAIDLQGQSLKVAPGFVMPGGTAGIPASSGVCLINGTLIADPTVGIGSGAGEWAADGSTPMITIPPGGGHDCIEFVTLDGGVTGTSPNRSTVASGIDNKSGNVDIGHVNMIHSGQYVVYNESSGFGGVVVHDSTAYQWSQGDAEFTQANWTSRGIWENSHDDWLIRTEFHWMGVPIYIDASTNTFTAVNNHPYNGGDGVFLPTASKLIYAAAGSNALFNDNYFDDGEIDLYSPNVQFHNNRYLYSSTANNNGYFIKLFANGQANPYQFESTGWTGTNSTTAQFFTFAPYSSNSWTNDFSQFVNPNSGSIDGFDTTRGRVIASVHNDGIPVLTLMASNNSTLGVRLALIDTSTTNDGTLASPNFEKAPYVRSSGNSLVLGAGNNDAAIVTASLFQLTSGVNLALAPSTPSHTATCTAGTIYADTAYLYVCTASGTVKRAALSSF